MSFLAKGFFFHLVWAPNPASFSFVIIYHISKEFWLSSSFTFLQLRESLDKRQVICKVLKIIIILFDNDVDIQLNLQLVPFVTSIPVTPAPAAALRTQLFSLLPVINILSRGRGVARSNRIIYSN